MKDKLLLVGGKLLIRGTHGLRLLRNASATSGVEISTVDTTPVSGAGIGGKYITLADASGAVYVWFNCDGGNGDPAPGGRGIEINLGETPSSVSIATALASTLDADSAFSASRVGNVVTITDAAAGARTDITAGDSGLTVAVTQQGF